MKYVLFYFGYLPVCLLIQIPARLSGDALPYGQGPPAGRLAGCFIE
jgi:hypothetical protein